MKNCLYENGWDSASEYEIIEVLKIRFCWLKKEDTTSQIKNNGLTLVIYEGCSQFCFLFLECCILISTFLYLYTIKFE